MAKKDQSGRVPAAAFSLDSDIQQILQRRSSKPWLPPDLISGVFRFLPRMLGFGISSAAAGVNGSARVSVNSSVLSAEQQAQFNARSKRPLGAAYATREVYTNGSSIEVSFSNLWRKLLHGFFANALMWQVFEYTCRIYKILHYGWLDFSFMNQIRQHHRSFLLELFNI